MADAGLQHIFTGSVVNSQLDVDLRDGEIPHHAVACDIQHLPVFRILQLRIFSAKYIAVEIIVGKGRVEGSGLPLRNPPASWAPWPPRRY